MFLNAILSIRLMLSNLTELTFTGGKNNLTCFSPLSNPFFRFSPIAESIYLNVLWNYL